MMNKLGDSKNPDELIYSALFEVHLSINVSAQLYSSLAMQVIFEMLSNT